MRRRLALISHRYRYSEILDYHNVDASGATVEEFTGGQQPQ